MTQKVDAFAASITQPPKRGKPCWRRTLEGEALEGIERAEQMMADGVKLEWATLSRELKEHFGIDIKQGQISKHYRQDCGCGK